MYSFNNNKSIFIINPQAGIIPDSLLIQYLKQFKGEFDFASFSTVEAFRGFIRSEIDNYDVFIAVGGDGTVNCMASELIGTQKIMGVLPVGSGNGFAREMGFKPLVKILAKDIRKKEFFDIDVIYVNDIPCINVFGLGLDSLVAHEFSNLRHRGFFNYGVSAVKVTSRIKPFRVSIDLGNEKISDDFYMVSVANTRQFGNNAFVAPMAKPDDGKFNLVLLRPFPKYMLPSFVFRMQTKTLKESKYLKYMELESSITIRSEEERVHIDGDPTFIKDGITVKIRRNALRILRSSFKK